MKNLFITITLSFFTLNFYGQSIESPNSEFELNFYLDKKGRPFYNLIYKKEKIIENSGLGFITVSYTHLRAHETTCDLVCRLLL